MSLSDYYCQTVTVRLSLSDCYFHTVTVRLSLFDCNCRLLLSDCYCQTVTTRLSGGPYHNNVYAAVLFLYWFVYLVQSIKLGRYFIFVFFSSFGSTVVKIFGGGIMMVSQLQNTDENNCPYRFPIRISTTQGDYVLGKTQTLWARQGQPLIHIRQSCYPAALSARCRVKDRAHIWCRWRLRAGCVDKQFSSLLAPLEAGSDFLSGVNRLSRGVQITSTARGGTGAGRVQR